MSSALSFCLGICCHHSLHFVGKRGYFIKTFNAVADVLVLHVGYFDLGGIFPLGKVLFLAEKLGSKESNMYLALYTAPHVLRFCTR